MTCYIIQCKYLNGNQNANHLFSDQWFTILEFYSFFFFQSGLRDYILKARTLNANSREILTKQQKHVSIIPISSGEVRSFILMVPSLKIKAKKKKLIWKTIAKKQLIICTTKKEITNWLRLLNICTLYWSASWCFKNSQEVYFPSLCSTLTKHRALQRKR